MSTPEPDSPAAVLTARTLSAPDVKIALINAALPVVNNVLMFVALLIRVTALVVVLSVIITATIPRALRLTAVSAADLNDTTISGIPISIVPPCSSLIFPFSHFLRLPHPSSRKSPA